MKQKRKKRILFYYMRGASAGGSDTCLYLLLRYLNQAKFEPFLLYRDRNKFLEELEALGIKTIPLPEKLRVQLHQHSKKNAEAQKEPLPKTGFKKSIINRLGSFGLFLSSMKDVIKRLPQTIIYAIIIIKNRVEIVHTNHYLKGDRPMLLAAILLRKKIVSHNRGLYGPDILDRFSSKYINQIVSMSDFCTSVYVKGGIHKSKCKTIYDGIETGIFGPQTTESNKIVVSCVGRIEKWKGQQVLVDAAETIVKEIRDIRFLLVGDGANFAQIKAEVKEKQLEKYFELTGHVTNVKDYMNQSTIIVHTSIEPEPFGMVIIEAMALEKPVIATNIGGPLEIIEDGKDGFLVPPGESVILANTILKLINDASLREEIGKNARQKVIDKFDAKKYAHQIERIYEIV